MTMETIIFLLNHLLTYCITVDLENSVLKCKYRVRIEQLFDRNNIVISVVPQYGHCYFPVCRCFKEPLKQYKGLFSFIIFTAD